VLSAENVAAALKHLTEHKVDVIFSDINLGESEPSGYELLEKVREKDETLPFYFVSGYSRREEESKAKKSGATGYLQLPVAGGQLKELVLK
jgi:DNA-binding NtrC family response regulator